MPHYSIKDALHYRAVTIFTYYWDENYDFSN